MEKVNQSIVRRHEMWQLLIQMSTSENTDTKIAKRKKKIGTNTEEAEKHASKIIRILETSKTEEEILQKVQAL